MGLEKEVKELEQKLQEVNTEMKQQGNTNQLLSKMKDETGDEDLKKALKAEYDKGIKKYQALVKEMKEAMKKVGKLTGVDIAQGIQLSNIIGLIKKVNKENGEE